MTIVLAVLSLYVVDFAINAASRMSSLGHIIGYAMGAVDLVSLLGTRLGDNQFKQLTVIASFGLILSAAVTCWAVTERVLVSVRHDPCRAQGRFKVVRQIWSTFLTLPPRIRGICNAVFWAWLGWFPFIIYSSTWVGETYFRYDAPPSARNPKDAAGELGRIGSMALTAYSMVSFAAAWILPVLIQAPKTKPSPTARQPPSPPHPHLQPPPPGPPHRLDCQHHPLRLRHVPHPFATSFRFATTIVALCGVPWCISSWAPTTFLGMEVNKLGSSSSSLPPHPPPPQIPRTAAPPTTPPRTPPPTPSTLESNTSTPPPLPAN
ncbi:hypothetical protein N0V88_004541 [Collariella sp. IMI 366227]|nr:hypothetical protein N0V88_004541 [Collariella sp. IMI 366227]